ncbi:hypothetical protein [Corynebacterium macginleyi]|uniref:hypothetical protein n=1 Tax=Corynebacterium macginleyi TaxID=38290 RepID=UPI00190D53DD|nr:hypothetical protein [Corynebacterium macginleyi]MBK4163687.1 hypothetical protein [Corynebacterium macginleyi]
MTLSTICGQPHAFAFGLVLLSGLSTSIGGVLAAGKHQPGPAFMAAAPSPVRRSQQESDL